jgi:hypothetical protein
MTTSTAPRERFPIARRVWRFARKARANWLLRHQNRFNFAIHMVGIPLTFVGLVLLFVLDWPFGVSAFVLGYLFQWVGHRVEGNDIGEMIPIKKLLGLPVVPIAPQFQNSPALPQSPGT